jgi:toxin ParE1/3/4
VTRIAIRLRPAARRDVATAAAWYAEQAESGLAGKFIEAVRSALDHIARHPASGSPRYALLMGLTGLRCRPVSGFPYLAFYVEREGWVDVLRVLHASRDIPESLRI